MIKETEISVFPNKLDDKELYKKLAAKNLKITASDITAVRVIRRSIDARGKYPQYKMKVKVYINEFFVDEKSINPCTLALKYLFKRLVSISADTCSKCEPVTRTLRYNAYIYFRPY